MQKKWVSTKIKDCRTTSATYVSMIIKDLLEVDWLYSAETFADEFRNRAGKVKVKKSQHGINDSFKPKVIDDTTVEIWKYSIQSGLDYMMYRIIKL